jgi:signal transduction histidine kinase
MTFPGPAFPGPVSPGPDRPRRLSLRARLLVLLVAVTAAFLLIMGAVTAIVLNRRLSGQFNAGLIAAASRPPAALSVNPAGDLAAVVAPRTGQVVLLTPGPLGDQLRLLLSQMSGPQLGRYGYRRPFTLVLAGGSRLRAVERPVYAARVPGAALPAGRALLVVARPVTALAGQVHGVIVAELVTGGVLLLVLALGGRWLIGRGLAPLSEMASTAQRITSQDDLAARMPGAGGGTEVGRLGAAINTMLDRIQQAFADRWHSEQRVRQFAADASHELRTPLTTIRGYAELYRQGALGPAELPDAMRRIEQEARRMSTLVAELLELARLDRGSSLDLAETDLGALARDAAADARAVEPGRPVTVEAPERLVAVADEARIRQVLANLLGNVHEHTPPGTPAVVRAARAPGGVMLEVSDAGPGMSAQDAAQAFDRFHRGTEQKGRASGPGAPETSGSGLGLAIVQAIAQAHGGQAVLDSRPGGGTRVRVWLPQPAASS